MEIISESDQLYRRIHPSDMTEDRASSKAFNDSTGQVSVDLVRLTTPEASVARARGPGYGLAMINASVLMEMGLQVIHDPTPDNPAHSLIVGVRTRAQRKLLAKAATMVIFPAVSDMSTHTAEMDEES